MRRSSEEELISKIASPSAATHVAEIQARAFVLGLHQHDVIAAKLIALCCRRHRHRRGRISLLPRARLIFRQVFRPRVCVWNALIRALSSEGEAAGALEVFVQMKKGFIKPDRFTFPSLLKACADLRGSLLGGAVHGEIVRLGLEGDPHVDGSLVSFYSKNGSLGDAVKVFDGMRARDVVSWNGMISCLFRRKEMGRGRELFERMPERNTVSWNAVIFGYVENGRGVEALEIFRRMQLEGWRPSESTFISVLSACSQVGALDLGKWIHRYIDLSSVEMELELRNSLIDMYAKVGSLENARKLFDEMRERNVVSWNCMIGALSLHGHGEEAIHLFEEMQRRGTSPDEITFVGVLSACAHAGLVEKGRSYFQEMEKIYGIPPQIEHHGCMIDILCRGGHLSDARKVIENMPVPPDAGVWGTLLAACRGINRLDLAEDALAHLLELEPWNAGNYVLLSNILAARGRWGEVEQVRLKMKRSFVGKTPGSSSIEIERSVWEFVSGDRSHPRSDEIYAALAALGNSLKLADHSTEKIHDPARSKTI